MATLMAHGKYVLCGYNAAGASVVIRDGGIVCDDGVVIDIGLAEEMRRKHDPARVIGSDDAVITPGFINGHHHQGLTPFQHGAPDSELEVGWANRIRTRSVDRYLDTVYSAMEMVASGVTTVQHMHSRQAGGIGQLDQASEEIIRAYKDVGMRVSYSYLLRDQNHFVYEDTDTFAASMPGEIATALKQYVSRWALPLDEYFEWFESFRARYVGQDTVSIQLAPANLHWCSDEALARVAKVSSEGEVPLHMHLLETPYQKEYAARRDASRSAVAQLQDAGLLGPRMTLGHCVWVTEEDLDILAATQTRVCHNASSNLRWKNGIAPLTSILAKGIEVCLGMDEATINDDRDMLQEMRLAYFLHRHPPRQSLAPTAQQILRMATEHGANSVKFNYPLGKLEVGAAADLVMFSWNRLTYPYADDDIPLDDLILRRGTSQAIDTVMVAGRVILNRGKFTTIDREQLLEELSRSMSVPRDPFETRMEELSRDVKPYVEAFYAAYLTSLPDKPFYVVNSRLTDARGTRR